MDWLIGNNVIIEFFGIEKDKKYIEKKENKIKICKENNIVMIELYFKDLKFLDKIFENYIQ